MHEHPRPRAARGRTGGQLLRYRRRRQGRGCRECTRGDPHEPQGQGCPDQRVRWHHAWRRGRQRYRDGARQPENEASPRRADERDEGGGGSRDPEAKRYRARRQRLGRGQEDRRAHLLPACGEVRPAGPGRGWMSILLDSSTKVIVQGITGREGSFHTEQMQSLGTRVVGGTSPGKGGTTQLEVPVFNTVADAVEATGANASGIFVPAPFAADAIMEAAAAGIKLIVCITEGIPIQDMIRVKDFLRGYPEARLIGANCPGLITPGQAKIGIIPQRITRPGAVGMVSRSGTLTYEVGSALSAAGMGQSTIVGIGGDPVLGMTFSDVVQLFEKDPATTHLVLIGEIGGSDEERAAELLARGSRLKAVAFISGRTAPEGKRMGDARAVISRKRGAAKSKGKGVPQAGVAIAE